MFCGTILCDVARPLPYSYSPDSMPIIEVRLVSSPCACDLSYPALAWAMLAWLRRRHESPCPKWQPR
jgi:hypothetical protein